MTIKFANNVSTTLANSALVGQTTMEVASVAGFPTLSLGDYFYGTLTNNLGAIEIVEVTSIAGNILTCVRGAEGTAPQDWTTGATFEIRVTAAGLTKVLDITEVVEEVQTATSGQTVFTLTTFMYAPGENTLSVYLDGINQIVGLSYEETSPSVVTFADPMRLGALVKFTTLRTSGITTPAAVAIYEPAGTGAVPTTVQAKLRESVSVADYSTVAQADAYAASIGANLYFPPGDYTLAAATTFFSQVIMASGAKLISAETVVFTAGFSAPLVYCLDLSGFVQFTNIKEVYPQWFGAMGDAVYCAASATAGSAVLTCAAPSGATTPGFTNGDALFVLGAGAAGTILQTTIVSGAGTLSITMADTASTTVAPTSAATRNDSVALSRFFAAVKGGANTGKYGASQPSSTGCTKLYIPHGIYCAFDHVYAYAGVLIEAEYGNTIGGARIIQCDISKPAVTVIADNFNSAGGSLNGGNGNNIFRGVGFASAYINDSSLNAPVLYFQNAWNVVTDTEIDHCLFQSTAGACIGAGFETTGSITAGSANLILANGSTFRSNGADIGGSRITVVGAGVAGANLVTYIVSGGGTNSVVLAAAAGTTVAGALAYPTDETLAIKINDSEFDVCRAGLEIRAGVTGSAVITNQLAFSVVRGCVRCLSVGDFRVAISDSELVGCGNPFNTTSAYRRSIYMNFGGQTNGELSLDNVKFTKSGSFGGPIMFVGRRIAVSSCTMVDMDTSDLQKFLYIVAAQIRITGNTFETTLLNNYTNSRVISFSTLANPEALDCSGNIFLNKGAGTLSRWIHSDFPIQARSFVGNQFIGLVSLVFDANIANFRNIIDSSEGYNLWSKPAPAAPAGGLYTVGDIVWNTGITNAAGQAVGFVCVVGGIPGTWRPFGVTV